MGYMIWVTYGLHDMGYMIWEGYMIGWLHIRMVTY